MTGRFTFHLVISLSLKPPLRGSLKYHVHSSSKQTKTPPPNYKISRVFSKHPCSKIPKFPKFPPPHQKHTQAKISTEKNLPNTFSPPWNHDAGHHGTRWTFETPQGFPTSNLPVPSPFGSFRCWFCVNHDWLHPWSLTWNLKMAPWKRRSLLETIICRFYVKLWGNISIIMACEASL